MDFSGRQVVVTGGTGALGTAVVADLLAAGATCTVPYVHEVEAQRFPCRGDPNVTLIAVSDLSDETQVVKVYDGLKPWASIHIAGGFAAGNVTDTDKKALMAQIDSNLASCFLCCRAAAKSMLAGGGGRIVNIAARPALEWRSGAGMTAYTIAKAGVAALTVARRGSCQKWHIGQCGRAIDHGHAAQSQGHAEGKLRRLAEGRRSRRDNPLSRFARQSCHARRDRSGIREILAGDRHQLERRAQEPLHRTGGDDRRALRIGLVIFLDVVEIVLIIDHQTVGLRNCAF
jgi:NAD(P)-dependent dehydrogenase (short-subunit alcohol dehydrogenase family)